MKKSLSFLKWGLPLLILFLFQNCGKMQSSIPEDQLFLGYISDKSSSRDLYIHSANPGVESSSSINIHPHLKYLDSLVQITTYGAYSPTTLGNSRIWFGGWISERDPLDYLSALDGGALPEQIFGPDKIFTATRTGDVVQSTASTQLAFSLKGYHVNDPTIIVPPNTDDIDRSQWLYMYFTMLNNRIAENCRQKTADLFECPELFAGHDIGMASSVDGGITWTYRGKAINAAESGDGKGAWMPSVLKINSELFLYYSSGSTNFDTTNIYRVKLNANGLTQESNHELVHVQDFQPGQLYANVDVKTFISHSGSRQYIMFANSGDQKKIHAFLSSDGIHFHEMSESPILASSDDTTLISPHIESLSVGSLDGHSTSVGLINLKLLFVRKSSQSAYEIRQTKELMLLVP